MALRTVSAIGTVFMAHRRGVGSFYSAQGIRPVGTGPQETSSDHHCYEAQRAGAGPANFERAAQADWLGVQGRAV